MGAVRASLHLGDLEVMSEIKPWPHLAGRPGHPAPKPIRRPCDAGLELAILNMETQLGTIEAFNRLAVAAAALRDKIDKGEATPQSPQYAIDVQGGPMAAEP